MVSILICVVSGYVRWGSETSQRIQTNPEWIPDRIIIILPFATCSALSPIHYIISYHVTPLRRNGTDQSVAEISWEFVIHGGLRSTELSQMWSSCISVDLVAGLINGRLIGAKRGNHWKMKGLLLTPQWSTLILANVGRCVGYSPQGTRLRLAQIIWLNHQILSYILAMLVIQVATSTGLLAITHWSNETQWGMVWWDQYVVCRHP